AWLPWLKPRSLWTVPRPTLGDFFYWILPLLVVIAGAGVAWLLVRLWFELARWLSDGPSSARFMVAGVLALTVVAMVFLLCRVLLLFFPRRRREYRWRKQLSALLSHRHGLGPGGVAALLEDDRLFAMHLQRFLTEHFVPVPLTLYDEQGRYLFASPGKVDVLA